jgi:hypothetical protein
MKMGGIFLTTYQYAAIVQLARVQFSLSAKYLE